jgi:hypothetical protein
VNDEGSLDQLDIADVVHELGQRRFTGRLLLERAEDRVVVSVEDGRLVFASSSNADHRLGPMLLRRGKITLRQMEDAVRSQTPGMRFGATLVANGVLDPKELVRGVVDQTREIILYTFRWTNGGFRLTAGKAAGEEITLNISTPQLLLDGITQLEAWSRIERGCGGLAALYEPSPGKAELLRHLTLDVDQTMLLQSVKDTRDRESLCAEAALNEFEVCRNLWAFRVIGLVRRVGGAQQPLDEDGLEFVLPNDAG